MPEAPESKDLIVVAIDPGVNGGVVWKAGRKVFAVRMPPTELDCVDLLRKVAGLSPWVEMYIEDPPLFTGRLIPGSAVGKLQKNYGVLLGASYALNFKVKAVRPPVWQTAHEFGKKGKLTTTEWKNKLKAKAAELYPDGVPVTLWSADALLILSAALKQKI